MKKHRLKGYNKPKRTPRHPKKSHMVLAKSGHKVKLIRFGQQGVKGAGKNPKTAKDKARKNPPNGLRPRRNAGTVAASRQGTTHARSTRPSLCPGLTLNARHLFPLFLASCTTLSSTCMSRCILIIRKCKIVVREQNILKSIF